MSDHLVICETINAITTHMRLVTAAHPIRLSGHASPQPRSLCGMTIAWDTEIPVRRQNGGLAARCRDCIAVYAKMRSARSATR